MNTSNERILVVGVRPEEREEILLWCTARRREVWFAINGLEALRVFDEVKPSTLVIDTLLPDIDSERLARTFAAASGAITTVFVGAHNSEAAYFSGGPQNTRYCHRPIDPEVVFLSERPTGSLGHLADRGAISRDGLAHLFIEILAQRATGLLYVGVGAFRKVIYFKEGHPHYATSTVIEENFGQFLLARGVITPIEFNCARNLQLREGIRQGEALVKIGVFPEARLEQLLADQIREKILNSFTLEHLPFHFDTYDAAVLRPRFRYNTFALILSALLRSDEHPAPHDPDSVIQVTPQVPFSVREELADLAGERFAEALGDGHLSLRAFGEALNSPRGAALLVDLLAVAGVLRLDEPQAPSSHEDEASPASSAVPSDSAALALPPTLPAFRLRTGQTSSACALI